MTGREEKEKLPNPFPFSLGALSTNAELGRDLRFPHLIVEYAGMFPGHVVTVTIVCKAHVHVSSYKVTGGEEQAGRDRSVRCMCGGGKGRRELASGWALIETSRGG